MRTGEAFAIASVDAVRRSDDFVTVTVTTRSNGHLTLEPSDEFCVTATWSTVGSAASDAGVSDAGVSDAGVADAGVGDAGVGDAGVEDAGFVDAGAEPQVNAGVVVDSFSRCSTVRAGFTVELTSNKPIPKPAVLEVALGKGWALGGTAEHYRVMIIP